MGVCKKIKRRADQERNVWELFRMFKNEKKILGLSESTLQNYEDSLKRFMDYMECTDAPIQEIDYDDVLSFTQGLQEEELSVSSINHYLRDIRAFFNWCSKSGYCCKIEVKLVKGQETVKETYSEEELKALLEKPQGDSYCEWRCWVIINWILATGNREKTVCNVRMRDINLPDEEIVLQQTKNKKIQIIPMSTELSFVLTQFIRDFRSEADDDEFLFCNVSGEQLTENISDESQSLKKEDGTAVNSKDQGLIDQIDKLFDDYASATGSADRTEDKLKNIFALSDYADLQSKLEGIGKSKGSKGIKKVLKNDEAYSNLVSELKDRNVSMDDLTDYIMAIAAPEAKDLEGIKENLKDEFSYNDKLYKFFKDKSDEDIKGFWDYYQTQGFDAKEYNWNKKDLEDNYDDYIKSKTTTPEESVTFASKFKNAAEDTATDIDTVTDNFQSDMKNIQSAMESVTNGTFQNSDMADLIQQFPELSNASGDLKDNLQDLAMDKGAEAIGKIRDSVKDVTDPKQLAQADKYVQSIMDTSRINYPALVVIY